MVNKRVRGSRGITKGGGLGFSTSQPELSARGWNGFGGG